MFHSSACQQQADTHPALWDEPWPSSYTTPRDTIGYEVETTKADPRNVVEELVSTLANAEDTADEIRMLFSVRSFRFIRLDRDEMKRIRPALDEHEQAVDELRSAIEMSGLFYNALRDESIDLNRVLAARLVPSAGDNTSEKDVTVYVED